MSALRMTLKDLLAHYMGINEGIINMLEHYFDMGRREAERSLELYKQFCWQTEKVVAFLDSSRRLSHSLRSAVPSLNHAPLSLAGALEEYLRDPNFEKNRTSYLQNRGKNGSSSAPKDGAAKSTTSAPSERPSDKHATDSRATESDAKNTSNASKEAPKTQNTNQQALQDFFEALEQPSSTPFQAAYSSFAGFNAQPDWFNAPQPTGLGMAPQPTAYNPFGPMPTGAPFMQPQMTGFNPFQAAPVQPMFTGAPAPSAPLAPQHTMATTPFERIFGQMCVSENPAPASTSNPPGGQPNTQAPRDPGLQPQPTAQPLVPQTTAQPANTSTFNQPFGAQSPSQLFSTGPSQGMQPTGQPFGAQPTGQPFNSPFAGQQQGHPSTEAALGATRSGQETSQGPLSSPTPAKTTSPGSSAPRMKPQKTGSMNPFSIPSDFEEPEPVVQQPKQPSLNELATQSWFGGQQTVQEPESLEPSGPKPVAPQSTGLMSSIASEFARPQVGGATTGTAGAQPPQPSASNPMGTQHTPGTTGVGDGLGHFGSSSGMAPQPTGQFGLLGSQAFGQPSGGPGGFPGSGSRSFSAGSQQGLGSLSGSNAPFSSSTAPTSSLNSQPTGLGAKPSALGPQATGNDLHAALGLSPGTGVQSSGLGSSQFGLGSSSSASPFRTNTQPLPDSAFSSRVTSGPLSSPSVPQLSGNNAPNTMSSGPNLGLNSGNQNFTGLGISSHQTGPTSPFSKSTGFSPQATGNIPSLSPQNFSTPFSTPGLTSSNFVNPHQPQSLQSQPTGFGGIKPFQPTSSFGHSLLNNNAPSSQPSTQTSTNPPTQDLLQF